MKRDSETLAPQNVAVFSAGAWGVVLASHLARKGHRVTAYDLPPVVEALRESRAHPNLPGFSVPDSVRLTSDLAEAALEPRVDCVVAVCPSHVMRRVAEHYRDIGAPPAPWIVCSKAIEEETLQTMTDVVESVLGDAWRERLAALSGPSFAAEVARGKPTTVTAASVNPSLSAYAQRLFMTERFRVYTHDDLLGVELGGALKNVVAIAAGVCDGMDLGDNARAALITRGLAEIQRLGVAMGARADTFAGLSGMGDLILTCAGRLSRNHQFGELLAAGCACREALAKIGMVVEGVRTARSIQALAQRHDVEMPIAREIHDVIYEGKTPARAVADLMSRQARPECDLAPRHIV